MVHLIVAFLFLLLTVLHSRDAHFMQKGDDLRFRVPYRSLLCYILTDSREDSTLICPRDQPTTKCIFDISPNSFENIYFNEIRITCLGSIRGECLHFFTNATIT